MEPTAERLTELRELIDEVIPADGQDTDTRLTDAQLEAMLLSSAKIEEAASKGWTRKAGMAMGERGGLVEEKAGDETLKFVSQKDFRDHCLTMADIFKAKAGKGISRLYELDPPTIQGVE